MKHPLTKTQNVLNRMRKAFEKGKGIVIRPDELQEMNLAIFRTLWEQQDSNLNLKSNSTCTRSHGPDSDSDEQG